VIEALELDRRLSRAGHAIAYLVVSLPVTLSVQGQLITGRLASALDYFDHIEHDIREARLGRCGEGVLSRVRGNRPPTAGNPLIAAMPPMYIHLVNARYVSRRGDYLPPQGSPALVWRGKIACVDGFSIGEFMAATGIP